jgi:low affinity Fe/Cu permease
LVKRDTPVGRIGQFISNSSGCLHVRLLLYQLNNGMKLASKLSIYKPLIMNTINEEAPDKSSTFEKISNAITVFSSTSTMFAIAVGLILIWIVTGPIFHYSNTWLLIVNTGTSIITFLMVFLIQKAQNKESIAVQLKLNELIAANYHASNRLLNIQDLSEDELNTLYEHYQKLVEITQNAVSNKKAISVEDAIDSIKDEDKTSDLKPIIK